MLLAGDIGGTNTRLGLFEAAAPRPAPVEVRTYPTGDFPTLESMLATFLADAGESPASIEGAAAARTTREVGLLAFLTGQCGRVGYERVISGPGLVNIHRFVHRAPCASVDPEAPDAAARISHAALDHRCQGCVETLDLFVAVLGAEAGNSALRGMTTGGVFLGGGIPPKIIPALEGGTFLDAFRAKAPMEDLVRAIPVHVVIHPDPGLLGAAVAAVSALAHAPR